MDDIDKAINTMTIPELITLFALSERTKDEDGNYHLERLVVKAENQKFPGIEWEDTGSSNAYAAAYAAGMLEGYEKMKDNNWVKVLPEVEG